MSFVPHHEIVEGDVPRRSAFILHGIMGSSRNWRSFAAELVEACPDWRAVLVDIRHHGRSLGAPPPDDVATCARDLVHLEDEIGPCHAVVGHSFGGKVAAVYALDHAPRLESAVILDCPLSPAVGAAENSEVGRVIASLRSIAMPVARRSEVTSQLERAGFPRALAGWMATNLEKKGGAEAYDWRFDLDGIERLLRDYWITDAMPLLESPPAELDVCFVRAAQSDRWNDEELARIAAIPDRPRLVRRTVADAGHWLHVDNPAGTLEAVAAALAVAG